MRKYTLFILVFLALSFPALAQEAPAPRKSPRMPVNKETLADHKSAVPTSHEVQGQAVIVDSERLRLGDFDLRLFGIVPPQLSASFGPQARSTLDELTAGQNVTCLIRDRDREGRFLATCYNANNADLALELLKRGLAVVARGSVTSTDFAAPYLAAEQAAETQKTGLWSTMAPAAAAIPDMPKNVPVAANTQAVTPPAEIHPRMVEEKPVPIVTKIEQKQPKTVEIMPGTSSVIVHGASDEEISTRESPGFLERYQLLVTGLIMLTTALGLLGAIMFQRRLDKRTEMRAIAAALRGELMAARAVCLGRLKSAPQKEDKDISWPRIRSTLYQAYVGRLGWLGAELARWVASIYGQASDYAAYYDGGDDTRSNAMPKRQALQTLIRHIDEILPRLAIIEHTGNPASAEAGLARAVSSFAPAQSMGSTANGSLAAITAPVSRLWTKVQDLAHRQWTTAKPLSTSPDPIAEYTALIEEEMKRFAFDDGEDETPGASVTRLQETGT